MISIKLFRKICQDIFKVYMWILPTMKSNMPILQINTPKMRVSPVINTNMGISPINSPYNKLKLPYRYVISYCSSFRLLKKKKQRISMFAIELWHLNISLLVLILQFRNPPKGHSHFIDRPITVVEISNSCNVNNDKGQKLDTTSNSKKHDRT